MAKQWGFVHVPRGAGAERRAEWLIGYPFSLSPAFVPPAHLFSSLVASSNRFAKLAAAASGLARVAAAAGKFSRLTASGGKFASIIAARITAHFRDEE